MFWLVFYQFCKCEGQFGMAYKNRAADLCDLAFGPFKLFVSLEKVFFYKQLDYIFYNWNDSDPFLLT